MDFFIANAYAEGAAAPQGGGLMGLVLPAAVLVFFYFLFIRPQQKKVKEQESMVKALKKGDEVVTLGGIVGTIKKVGENFITLTVAENVDVNIQSTAVGNLLPKGSLKKL
jgi:preprotein translocase subunit YajC